MCTFRRWGGGRRTSSLRSDSRVVDIKWVGRSTKTTRDFKSLGPDPESRPVTDTFYPENPSRTMGRVEGSGSGLNAFGQKES